MNLISRASNRLSKWQYPAQLMGWSETRRGAIRYTRFCETVRRSEIRARRDAEGSIDESSIESLHIPEDDGYLIIPPDRFPEMTASVLEARKIFAAAPQDKVATTTNKDYFRHVETFPEHVRSLESPFLRLALNPAVIKSVSSYVGILPLLHYQFLAYSPAQMIGGTPKGSQCFHIDHEAARQVKAFLYINEVNDSNGPLTIVKAKESERILRLHGDIKPVGKRYTDEAILSHAAADSVVRLTAQAGTLVLVDTSRCFHFGSRTGDEDRLVLIYQYLSPFSPILPWNLKQYSHFPYSNLSNDSHRPYEKKILAGY